MFQLTKVPPEHTKLLITLGTELKEEDVEKLRIRCQAADVMVPPRLVEKETAHGLMVLLDRRRIMRPGEYSKLEELLNDVGRSDLVYRLISNREGSNSAIDSTPPPSGLSDSFLQKFSETFGKNWKFFVRSELGVTDNEISMIQQSRPHDSVREHLFQVFKLWREKNKGTATIDSLLEKCENYDDLDPESTQCVKDEIDRLKTTERG